MQDDLSRSFSSPIFVDRSFFEAVELRLRAFRPLILEERAQEHGVTVTQIESFIRGRSRIDKSKLWRLERARDAASFRYDIRWENGISSTRYGVDDAMEVLEWEIARPKSLKISIGEHSAIRASIEIDSHFDKMDIRASGPRGEISSFIRSIESLLSNHAPQNRVLHLKEMPSFLATLTLISFVLSFIYFSFEAGRQFATAGADRGSGFAAFSAICFAVLVGFLMTASSAQIWRRTFPTIEFPFGRGRNAARRRSAAFICLGYILLPLAVSFIASLIT